MHKSGYYIIPKPLLLQPIITALVLQIHIWCSKFAHFMFKFTLCCVEDHFLYQFLDPRGVYFQPCILSGTDEAGNFK